MARRKIPPMPIEGLYDHPEAMTLSAAAFGMLTRLALHFWSTECRPLPIADHELRGVCRAHSPTWRHWKASILRIFEAIRPELESTWQARENRVGNLIRLSQRSSSMRRANALRSKANASMTGGNASANGFPCLSPQRVETTRARAHTVTPAGKRNDGWTD
jgi:uncharacterized protein YdaU (DUF1376 family)